MTDYLQTQKRMPPKYLQRPVPRFVDSIEGLFEEITEEDYTENVKGYDSKLKRMCNDFFYSMTSKRLEDHLNVEIIDKKEMGDQVDILNLEMFYPYSTFDTITAYYNIKNGNVFGLKNEERIDSYQDIAHEIGHYLFSSSIEPFREEINAIICQNWAIEKINMEVGTEIELINEYEGFHKKAETKALNWIKKRGYTPFLEK